MDYWKKIKQKDNSRLTVAVVIALLFWGYIYINVPVGHDDWTWGSQIGIERMQSFLKDYNGRYLGSLVTVILTRTYFIRMLMMSVTTVGISLLIARIGTHEKKNRYRLFIIANLLMLLTPREIFKQTFSWIAGFSNYVPPILLVLIYLADIKDVFSRVRVERKGKLYILGMFILGVATQLFVEHMTLYLIMLVVAMILYSGIKFKKVYKVDISMLLGSIAGAMIMFSNGAYHKISDNEDGYRTMATSLSDMIQTAVDQYVNIINKQFFMDIIVVAVILAILVILLIIKENKKDRLSLGTMGCLAIIVAYPMYLIYINHYTETVLVNESVNGMVQAMFSPLFYIAIGIVLLVNIKNHEKRDKALFLLGSALVILGPLMVVTPIGGRNFLVSYMFLVMLVVELMEYLVPGEMKAINEVCLIATLLVMSQLGMIFCSIGADANYRNRRIMRQIEQGVNPIYVPRIQYAQYLQVANPRFGKGYGAEYGFRAYYGLSKETQVLLGDLKDEENIEQYLEKIKSQDYLIVIAAKDEASKGITNELTEKLKNLGLNKGLQGKLRASYIGIIDGDEVVFEELSDSQINANMSIDDINVNVISAGFEVGNKASIMIGDKEYAINRRGINIVIYDKKDGKIIDSVAFDTHDTGKAYR